MPVLNSTGDVCDGIVSGQISVNGQVPAALVGVVGGLTRWLTNTVLIFQDETDVPGAATLWTYDTAGHTKAQVSAQGANQLGAGGGFYGAFLAGQGVRTNTGLVGPFPPAYMGMVGADGTLAILTDYQSGTGIAVYTSGGTLKLTSSVTVVYTEPIPVRGDYVMASSAAGWRLQQISTNTGVLLLTRTAVVSWAVPVTVTGPTVWVVERTEGLSLRLPGSTDGYAFPNGNYFAPDAIEVSAGVVRICYNLDPSGYPNNTRLIDITVATGAWSLGVPTGSGTFTFTAMGILGLTTFAMSGSTTGMPTTGGGGGGPVVGPGGGSTTNIVRRAARPVIVKPVTRRDYPHVKLVGDPQAQRALTLLWDQHYALQEQLDTIQATQATHADAINTVASQASAAQQTADSASAIAGKPTSSDAPGLVGGGAFGGDTGGGGTELGGGGGTPSGVDDGLGGQGCSQAGPTGHVTAGTPLTAVTAGIIVCGTANEFPALAAPAVDQPTRDANQAQLLGRIIWHLHLAGFAAGKQKNPSGAISGDKVTIQISGEWRAYDVFQGVPFNAFLPTHMNQVFPASYVADGGVSD